MGGATNRIAKDATAYPHRDVNYIINLHTRWETQEEDQACITLARKLFEATKMYATGGVYSNFISEGDENISGAYAGNVAKLSAIKKNMIQTMFFALI